MKFYSKTLATLLLTGNLSQAAVIWNFAQVGNDVVATPTGSIIVPSVDSFLINATFVSGSSLVLINQDGDVALRFGGTSTSTSLNADPTTGSGDNFGHDGNTLGTPVSAADGSTFAPNATLTWENTTIAGIGLGSLSASPLLAHTTSNGETISYALSVPEPSSALLVSLGLFAGLSCRRRS